MSDDKSKFISVGIAPGNKPGEDSAPSYLDPSEAEHMKWNNKIIFPIKICGRCNSHRIYYKKRGAFNNYCCLDCNCELDRDRLKAVIAEPWQFDEQIKIIADKQKAAK